jgi:hypothetical protein
MSADSDQAALEIARLEREKRIAVLEKRTRQRDPVGVKPLVALVGILGCAAIAWVVRLDLAYLVSPRQPLSLGAEGDYKFEALQSNRYAQIHGVPTLRGAYSVERGTVYVVVGLRDTPILLRRPALPGEEWNPNRGGPPPQPNQTPFAVRGRLLSQDDASRYQEGFQKLTDLGQVRPRDGKLWILIEGQQPGRDLVTALIASGLMLFSLLNLYLLVRGMAHRVRPET